MFPNIQFYDYTKVKSIANDAKNIPNYHVTFSQSENNILDALEMFENGSNFASVFFPIIPKTYMGLSVYDGDETDLTFTYPSNKVVGLYLKVPRKKRSIVNSFIKKSIASGFVNLVVDGQIVNPTDENIEKATEDYFKIKYSKMREKRNKKQVL